MDEEEERRWREEERRALRNRLLRWGFGIPLMLSFPWLGLLSVYLALLGCILIAPDVAGYISDRVAGGILGRRAPEKPPPLYSFAESRAMEGKYQEAEQEYEKIIREFPDEVRPHIGLIEIAVIRLHDGDLADRLYERGLQCLKGRARQELLTRRYREIRTRLKPVDGVPNTPVHRKQE